MEKINSNLLEKIKNKIFSDALSLVKIRLEIAKNIFILSAFLYFLFLLMTIGWYEIPWTSKLTFLFYPVFVLSLFALLFQLANYLFVLYFEKWAILKYGIFGILSVVYIAILAIHLGVDGSLETHIKMPEIKTPSFNFDFNL